MRSPLRKFAALGAAVLVVLAVAVAPAQAFSIPSFDGTATDASGEVETQAGAHADVTTTVDFPEVYATGKVRDVVVDLPKGLVGNPQVAAECTTGQLAGEGALNAGLPGCPDSSQVGVVKISSPGGEIWDSIFNMKPIPGIAASFGFNIGGALVLLNAVVHSDGSLSIVSTETNEYVPIEKVAVTLWGVPAEARHDVQRGQLLSPPAGTSVLCAGSTPTLAPCPAHTPPLPFISLPTDCTAGPVITTVRANSWQDPEFGAASFVSHDDEVPPNPVGVSGCDSIDFSPSLDLTTTTQKPESPTGVSVKLGFAQSENPNGLSTSPLKDATVVLPEGMTVSPSSAAGLGGCSDQQLDLGNDNAVQCPDSAKIGSIAATTPLLDEALGGSIYLRSQASNDPESGEMFRIALVVENKQRGVLVKLPGQVRANAKSGQLTASFKSNPQLPVSTINVDFDGGPKAPLVTPSSCGEKTVKASLTSWSGKTVDLESSFAISCRGDSNAFNPKLEAGTVNPTAGAYSPFTLRVTREDGQQNLAGIEATLPDGVLAKLAGVSLCGDAGANTGNCPQASQVGTTTVGAGAGSSPIYVPQQGKSPTAVYLAGPYKGAPLSLVVKVPAQAGPFDLGTVTVRNALNIDPSTAQVTAKSDSLPQIVSGVPISYRDVRVEVNRPDFTLNPTSCDPMSVTSTISSVAGKTASPSSRFQVGSCENLGFAPKLALRLFGPTHRSAHPKLQATLTMPKGGANIAKAQVILPKTEILENAHIQTICTRVQYAAKACPAKSVYGYAKAWTPLLDQPLQGPVYLRSSNHELPDLVASLDGQIHVDLAGRIDSVNARIRNTFEMVPDAPVSKFVLTMQGGKKGLLVNNTELCKATPRANVEFDGQNGKTADLKPVVKADCRKKRKRR
jgi:hypothetical protein